MLPKMFIPFIKENLGFIACDLCKVALVHIVSTTRLLLGTFQHRRNVLTFWNQQEWLLTCFIILLTSIHVTFFCEEKQSVLNEAGFRSNDRHFTVHQGNWMLTIEFVPYSLNPSRCHEIARNGKQIKSVC